MIAKFDGYGEGNEVSIVASRATHWHLIEASRGFGTKVYLDTGREVCVQNLPDVVEKRILEALTKK